MTPTELLAHYPPASDVATRGAVVSCPSCEQTMLVPTDYQGALWYVPHADPCRRGYGGEYYSYHTTILKRHAYGVRGEIVWIWLPEVE